MSDAATPPPVPVDHPGWQGILDPGEQILWQGRPEARIRLDLLELGRILPGLFMVGFALFWMWGAAYASPLFAAFGLIFVFTGLRQMLGQALRAYFTLSCSFYTLTDHRAIIGTDMPFQGRRLVSYPIDAATTTEYVATEPPSIMFGPAMRGKRTRPGFHFVADADRVMAMIRQIQRGSDRPADGAGA
ncbi:aspartate carbamoyltransferase catalytic subunit [Paracoccus xiamenensis]|uniref:aspartate carbamoyltransferase catalytic subunit n=1 Tax=Paracoccus xiamenensis TaxID=2714901 RepID=UPI00140C58FC|nr:aspartate carbamoyltransferase catalytic subunit [Paracoccus xiamenensis]NHF73933.1 aspartate carbamoyltransferase catalytic subunit [Paracoccus xiamenensis]